MDWTRQIDGYCERMSPAYWAEPVNAVTNAAFIIAALLMLTRVRGNRTAQLMAVIMLCIGTGSFLFHTFATAWAALADVLPIAVFILVYLFAVNRRMIGASLWLSTVITALFIPFAAIVVPMINLVPFLAISNFYWTVPLLLVIYAMILHAKHPQTAQGFLVGAALLTASIILRSLDEPLCQIIPFGTHFFWHILNAVMLAYMIHVYYTHVLAAERAGR